MVVVVIATLLGIWGLSSSRMGILKAGNQAAQTKLELLAEQGLQKALSRVQEIANCCTSNLVDTVGKNLSSAKTISWLNGVPTPSGDFLCQPPPTSGTGTALCTGTTDPACLDSKNYFGTNTDVDVVNQNVVCNFMGKMLKDTQVTLVRKTDLQATTQETDAVFLVNSVARDSSDRRQVVQGVIILPYDQGTGYALLDPYLATSTKSAD
jgi:hypothetical protein